MHKLQKFLIKQPYKTLRTNSNKAETRWEMTWFISVVADDNFVNSRQRHGF